MLRMALYEDYYPFPEGAANKAFITIHIGKLPTCDQEHFIAPSEIPCE
jgi:hypothetical protein